MQITFTPGSGFGPSNSPSVPAGLVPAAAYVANLYDTIFTNPITLNLTLNWAPQQGSATGGVLATNNSYFNVPGYTIIYSALRSDLIAIQQSPTQIAAYKTLPGTDPTGNSSSTQDYYLTPGQAEILGAVLPVNGVLPAIGGYVTVSSEWYGSSPKTGPFFPISWSFTPGSVPSYDFDAVAAIAHETTETMMGRISQNGIGSSWTVMDLFRYSSSGGQIQRDLQFATSNSKTNTTAYFSYNNGSSNLGTWNNVSGNGDLGDWTQGQPPIPNDAFGVQGGGLAPISEADFQLMNILGWNLSPDVVFPGEDLPIGAGVTSSGLMVIYGGVLIAGVGGTALDTNYNGGTGLVAGLDTGAQVWAGGVQYIYSGGIADATIVQSAGTQIVNGGLSEDAYVGIGGVQIVQSGGELFQITPGAGPGVAFNTTVAGGQQVVSAGGQALATTVGGLFGSGGLETIEYGGRALETDIIFGGTEQVYGLDAVAAVQAGGVQQIFAGGTATRTIIDGQSTQKINYGGLAVSATLSGAGAAQIVEAGTASATTIGSGGAETVYGARPGHTRRA